MMDTAESTVCPWALIFFSAQICFYSMGPRLFLLHPVLSDFLHSMVWVTDIQKRLHWSPCILSMNLSFLFNVEQNWNFCPSWFHCRYSNLNIMSHLHRWHAGCSKYYRRCPRKTTALQVGSRKFTITIPWWLGDMRRHLFAFLCLFLLLLRWDLKYSATAFETYKFFLLWNSTLKTYITLN